MLTLVGSVLYWHYVQTQQDKHRYSVLSLGSLHADISLYQDSQHGDNRLAMKMPWFHLANLTVHLK